MIRGFRSRGARIVDPKPLHRADPKVLEHHVGALEQAHEQRFPFWMLQVDRDALLVPVQVHEVRGFVTIKRRPPRARHVASAGRLDLDDVRAIVGQHRGSERPREGMRQIEDRDVVQGAH